MRLVITQGRILDVEKWTQRSPHNNIELDTFSTIKFSCRIMCSPRSPPTPCRYGTKTTKRHNKRYNHFCLRSQRCLSMMRHYVASVWILITLPYKALLFYHSSAPRCIICAKQICHGYWDALNDASKTPTAMVHTQRTWTTRWEPRDRYTPRTDHTIHDNIACCRTNRHRHAIDASVYEKLKAKNNRMVTFVPFDSPRDHVASDMTKSDSSIILRM